MIVNVWDWKNNIKESCLFNNFYILEIIIICVTLRVIGFKGFICIFNVLWFSSVLFVQNSTINDVLYPAKTAPPPPLIQQYTFFPKPDLKTTEYEKYTIKSNRFFGCSLSTTFNDNLRSKFLLLCEYNQNPIEISAALWNDKSLFF